MSVDALRRRRRADAPESASATVTKESCAEGDARTCVVPFFWKFLICCFLCVGVYVSAVSRTRRANYSQEIRSDDAKLLVGFASRDVTPQKAMWLSGFASRSRPLSSEEVLMSSKSLLVRAMSVRSADLNLDSTLILVAIDLIGADKRLSDRIYARIRAELGYSRASVRLCFSHTHSGPFVSENLFPLAPDDDEHKSLVDSYAKDLERVIVDVIRDATNLSTTQLARAHYNAGYATLAVNRRQIKEAEFDGTTRGDTEDGVSVLWFVAVDTGNPIGGTFGYSAHASVATSTYRFHGDYPGVASAELEKKFGGSWLFVCGVAGDQNVYPRGSLDLAVKHGTSLAAEVSNIMSRTRSGLASSSLSTGTGLQSTHEFISLPYRVRYNARNLKRMSRSQGSSEVYTRRMAGHWLDTFDGRNDRKSLTPAAYEGYPISLWRIGRLQIVFLGGEPTLGYIAALTQCVNVSWVVGYSDDVMGYVGTAEVLREGLREGSDRAAIYYGLPAAWNPIVEDLIVSAVCRLSKLLSSK